MRTTVHLEAEIPRGVVELTQATEALEPGMPVAQVEIITARTQANEDLHGRAPGARVPGIKDDAHARRVDPTLVEQLVPYAARVLESAGALVGVHELVPERGVEHRGRADAEEVLYFARGVHHLLETGDGVRVRGLRTRGHARHLPEHVRVEVRKYGRAVFLHVLHDLEIVLPGRDGAVVEFQGRECVEYGGVAFCLERDLRALANGFVCVEGLGKARCGSHEEDYERSDVCTVRKPASLHLFEQVDGNGHILRFIGRSREGAEQGLKERHLRANVGCPGLGRRGLFNLSVYLDGQVESRIRR